MDYKSDAIELSGPMLAIMIELAKKLKFSLSYFRPVNDSTDSYYEKLDSGEIDMHIYPTPPTNQGFIVRVLSAPLGFMYTISILSGSGYQQIPIFNFIECFDHYIWTLILLSYAVTGAVATYLRPRTGQYLFYYSIMVNQSNKLPLKQYTANYTRLMMCWLFLTSIIYWSFHEAFLSSVFHTKPHVKIDSIEDLATFAGDGRLREFYAMTGESIEDYVKYTDDPVVQALEPRMRVLDISENEKDSWEADVFPKVATGDCAIVSDNAFLDYYYITKLAKYPNLYRAKQDFMALPYFIALSPRVTPALMGHINSMISRFILSGIYEHLISEALFMNNDALHQGIIGDEGEHRATQGLKSAHLYGAYILFNCGLIVSIFLFAAETVSEPWVWRQFWHKTNSDNNYRRKVRINPENLKVYRRMSLAKEWSNRRLIIDSRFAANHGKRMSFSSNAYSLSFAKH